MGKTIRTMLDLIAYEVCGTNIDKSQYFLTDEELVKLYKLSKPIQKARTMSACFLTAVFIWSCITV